jgi:hypothetical protein
MPFWLRQLLIQMGVIKPKADAKGGAMTLTLDKLKDAVVEAFETDGKDLLDKIVGHYKDVGADKVELGKKFTKLLLNNGKDLIRGKITREQHDQNVNDLWNAQKSDVLSTAYEEKVTLIGALLDGVKMLGKMAIGILGKFTPST